MTSNRPMYRSTATSASITSIRGNNKSMLEAAFQKAIYPILKNNFDVDVDNNDKDDGNGDGDGGSVDNEAHNHLNGIIHQRPNGSDIAQNDHVSMLSMSTSMSMSIPMRMLLQGPSQCGKTSLAMDLAYSIASSPSTCCTIVNANNGQHQNNGDGDRNGDVNADGDIDMDMDMDADTDMDAACEQQLKCTHCQLPFFPTESSSMKNVPFHISSYCSCCAVLFFIPEWKREQSLLDFPLPCYEHPHSESASSGSKNRSRNHNHNHNQENNMQSNREGKDDTIGDDDGDDDASSHFWRDHERFQESMRKLEQQEQELNGNGNINGGDSSRNTSATTRTRNINRKMRLRAQRRMVALQRIRIKYIHSCQHLVESLASISISMSMSIPISMASESDDLSQPPSSPNIHTCGLSGIIVDDLDSYIRKSNHNNDANENGNSNHRGELDESVRLLFHDGNKDNYENGNGNGANDTSTSVDSGVNNKGQGQHEIDTNRHGNEIPQMTPGGQQQQQQQASMSITQGKSGTALSSDTKKMNSYSNSSTTETMRLLQLLAIMSDTCNHIDNCKRILLHNQGRNLEIPMEDQPTPVSEPMKLLTCINTDTSFTSSNDLNHMMKNYVTTIGTISKNDNSNKNKNKTGENNNGNRRVRHHNDEIIIDNFESMDAEQYKRHNSGESYNYRHINTHRDLAAQSQIASTWLMNLEYAPWQASTLSNFSPANGNSNDTTSSRNGRHTENSNGKGAKSHTINVGKNINAEAIYSIGWSSSSAIGEIWECRIDDDVDLNGDDEQLLDETDVSVGGYGEVEDDEANSIYWNIQ